MSDAVTKMIAMDTHERRQVGAGLRRCVEEHFSVRSMNAAYGTVYRDLVARNSPEPAPKARRKGPPDSELTLPRRMARHWPLVVGLALLGGGAGLGYAAYQPPEYQAKSSVVVGEVFTGTASDDSIKASTALAASYADLARREPVLRPVAAELQLGDWRLLVPKVHSQPGDKNPLLIQIITTAGSNQEATQLAEAVATRLVALTTSTARSPGQEFAVREMDRLSAEISTNEQRIDELTARLDSETDLDIAAALQADLQGVRENLTELEAVYQSMLERFVTGGFAGDVQVVEHAYATPSPFRPDPISLTAAGLVAGLMLAAGLLHLAAGGRRTPTPDGQSPPQIQFGEIRPMHSERWSDDQLRTETTQRREGGRR
jgi:uncharacterized protein involved in exopolysaccharide biosynthesis